MKKIVRTLSIIALLLSTVSVSYAWWTAHPRIEIRDTQVTARVLNRSSNTIYCRGNVYGETASGFIQNAWNEGYVQPGKYMFFDVFLNREEDAFQSGWATIRCENRE